MGLLFIFTAGEFPCRILDPSQSVERERNVSLLNLIVLAHACGAGLGVLLEGVDGNGR